MNGNGSHDSNDRNGKPKKFRWDEGPAPTNNQFQRQHSSNGNNGYSNNSNGNGYSNGASNYKNNMPSQAPPSAPSSQVYGPYPPAPIPQPPAPQQSSQPKPMQAPAPQIQAAPVAPPQFDYNAYNLQYYQAIAASTAQAGWQQAAAAGSFQNWAPAPAPPPAAAK